MPSTGLTTPHLLMLSEEPERFWKNEEFPAGANEEIKFCHVITRSLKRSLFFFYAKHFNPNCVFFPSHHPHLVSGFAFPISRIWQMLSPSPQPLSWPSDLAGEPTTEKASISFSFFCSFLSLNIKRTDRCNQSLSSLPGEVCQTPPLEKRRVPRDNGHIDHITACVSSTEVLASETRLHSKEGLSLCKWHSKKRQHSFVFFINAGERSSQTWQLCPYFFSWH